MESEALKYVGAGLATLGMLGGAVGVGNIFAALLNGISRNPGSEGKIVKYAFIGMALAEGLGIFSFVVALILLFNK